MAIGQGHRWGSAVVQGWRRGSVAHQYHRLVPVAAQSLGQAFWMAKESQELHSADGWGCKVALRPGWGGTMGSMVVWSDRGPKSG